MFFIKAANLSHLFNDNGINFLTFLLLFFVIVLHLNFLAVFVTEPNFILMEY